MWLISAKSARACARACVRACVCVRARARVRACVRVCVCAAEQLTDMTSPAFLQLADALFAVEGESESVSLMSVEVGDVDVS